jgi:predicted O-linked N-acetylglucosamine transferase (SPINDLY family)
MTPEIFHNQGIALAQQNRLAEALVLLDKALGLNPNYGDAHNNRGVILQQLGRMEEAVASYDRALRLRPDNPGAWYNRGNALVQLKRMDDAVASYDKALKFAPSHVETLMNRGYALMHLKRADQALASFEKVTRIKPGYPDAHHNRGRALADLNRLEDAVVSYDVALQLKPDYAAAHNDRGNALLRRKQLGDALASYERAVQSKPDYAEAYFNRGTVLAELKQVAEAIADLDRALRIRSDNGPAQVLKAYYQAKICDWSSRTHRADALAPGIDSDGIQPFLLLGMDDDPSRQLARAKRWANENYLVAPNLRPRTGARPGKLRIGYFSADFRDHPVMQLMARLLELHDRNRFEVHLFSFGEDVQDAMRDRAWKSADQFHDAGSLSDHALVELARELGIDIAIDLMGYTKGSRTEVFSHRVAPLQVNYLGYPGTMGAAFMDYIIADKWVVPDADRPFYTEKVIHLPHTYMPSDNSRAIAEDRFSRADMGLPESGFVFCCFNNSYKISPAEFDVWMRLLGKVPGSVLWLSRDNEVAGANLYREAQARGIDRERLIFAERMPSHADYMARYRCADLFLDTFNYNAHTTANDALWAGLPLITKPGQSFAARVAASLLNAIGMPELVTDSLDTYEELALALATNPVRLATLKTKLAANRLATPLFDSEAFTREIEKAYDAIFERQLQEQA